jgi:hypothetical protein
MATRKEESIAVITIRNAGTMKPKTKIAVGKWMRKQADMLATEGYNYTKRFTARYIKT